MLLAFLLPLALGLDCVAASPCKPSSSGIATSTATKFLDPSSTLLTDAPISTEKSDSTAITTITISESISVTDDEPVTSTALSDISISTSAESTSAAVSHTFTSASTEFTSSTDLESETSDALSDISVSTSATSTSATISHTFTSTTTELTSSINVESKTSAATLASDSTTLLTHTSIDPKLEPTTTSITEQSTHTTIPGEVPTSSAETSTALLPIPTLFSLNIQGGVADGLLLQSNGEPDWVLAVGWTLPTGQFTYDEATGHLLVNGNPVCMIYQRGNNDFVTLIGCPTVITSNARAPLVCDRPTGSKLKCSVPVSLVTCTRSNGVRTCTTTEYVWDSFYSWLWSPGVYQIWAGPAEANLDSNTNPIEFMIAPL